MKIIVTGASGDLASRVIAGLLKEVPASDLILTTRKPGTLSQLAAHGAQVRQADFNNPAGLAEAFRGGSRMLLISTLSVGLHRVEHHRNALQAAQQAGVTHVVYTSSVGMHPQTPAISGREHLATEQMLNKGGLDFTILRDSWYADVFANHLLKPALISGMLEMSLGDGLVAPVAKQDCAECAARVLLTPDRHVGAVYEITGPELLTLSDMVALGSRITGKPIRCVTRSAAEQEAYFDSIGVSREYYEGMENDGRSPWASNEMISYQKAIEQGFFAVCSRHVQFITGRPALTMQQVIESYGPYVA